ncbi:MAG: flagellar basal body-associated FliL family protein [Candidatus Caldatribacteriota bacterium]
MAEDNKPGTGSQSKNPLLILLIITNIITMSAVAYYQWRFMQLEAKRPSLEALLKEGQRNDEANDEVKSEVVIKEEKLLQLESFTVNLAQGDGPRRYLRLDAVLKMSDDAKKEEFEARKPQIRDTIISILNTKRADDLLKREGKDYLKEEIKSSINSFLIDGRVEDVYYISFQIN